MLEAHVFDLKALNLSKLDNVFEKAKIKLLKTFRNQLKNRLRQLQQKAFKAFTKLVLQLLILNFYL